jgi:hypothetical protein
MQTMGEFASLTERLALMPDPALQQFAQMHKEDPFTLALAVSESNRRRKMRTAQQGVAGMQPQPPVADQEIAQMAAPAMPENVGIGALSAPTLAGMPAGGIAGEDEAPAMAGGGLVAFADGGNVERYQTGGVMRQPGESFTDYRARVFQQELADSQMRRAQEESAREVERQRRLTERGGMVIPPSPFMDRPALPGVAPTAAAEPPVSPTYRDEGALRMRSAPPIAAPDAAAPPADRAAPRAAPGAAAPRAAPGSAPAAGAASATMPGGIGDINAMLKRSLSEQKYEDPAKADVEKLGRTLQEGSEGRLKSFDEYVQKTGDVFKGREERLGKREAEIGKQKDTNTGLAFLNAGLAIMSTPGGLATAIGKGARVGTEQFAAGLDKIRSAQEKLDEARDRTEELKLNRADMTFKDRQALLADIDKSKADALRLGIEGTRMAAGVTEKRASDIVGKQVQVGIAQFDAQTRKDIAAMQERGANARANAPAANMQMAAALGGGTTPEQLLDGLRKINEAATGKTDMRTLYATYLTGLQRNPGAEAPLSYSQFIGQFAIPTAPGNNPAAAPGTVRDRP